MFAFCDRQLSRYFRTPQRMNLNLGVGRVKLQKPAMSQLVTLSLGGPSQRPLTCKGGFF